MISGKKLLKKSVLMSRIETRIKEIEEFNKKADEESNGDWFEVSRELFKEYDLPECSDNYYTGEVIDGILFELKKILR